MGGRGGREAGRKIFKKKKKVKNKTRCRDNSLGERINSSTGDIDVKERNWNLRSGAEVSSKQISYMIQALKI